MDFEKDLKLIRYVFTVTVLALLLMVGFNSVRATYDPKITANSKTIRTGSVAVTALETTKAVTFSSAMPTASYTVFFERGGAVASVLNPSSKTTAGFTMNVSVGLVETINYVAIEQ